MGGREENRPKCCFFRGKRHDNRIILKVQILLSRNCVVIAQAPTLAPLRKNGDTFSIKAPKECSKKVVATLRGKVLTRGNVLRIFFLFLEDLRHLSRVSPLELL